MRHIEINQQADLMITELQVRRNLSEMQRVQFFHRLQLNDDAFSDKEIDSIPRIDLNPVIYHRQPQLMVEFNAIFCELIPQARVVRALEASCAQSGVHFHGSAQNLLGDLFVKHDVCPPFLLSSVVESFSMVESVLQSPVL